MDSSFYIPVLKSKEGEFTALANLDQFTRKHIYPLFDVTPLEFDNQTGKKPKTLEEHIYNFCHKKFLKKWLNADCFIDTFQLNGMQVHEMSCLEYIYLQLNGVLIRMHPAPVVRLKSDDASIECIRKVMTTYKINDLGLRVKIEDITAAGFNNNVATVLEKLNFVASDTHLILDLADSDFSQIEDFSDAIIAILDGFPFLSEWKSFTICSGAFPQTSYLRKGVNQVARNDWKFFKEVKRKLSAETYGRPVNYGDYGIVSPGYFEFDPLRMSRSANIRYTLNDIWFVVKGSALKKSTDFAQYIEQATKITTADFYYGEAFSKGDLHLKNCSLKLIKPGTPTVWNWAGNNHHFTKVVSDLFSNPRAA
jgi:hypothetical protein